MAMSKYNFNLYCTCFARNLEKEKRINNFGNIHLCILLISSWKVIVLNSMIQN